MSFSSPIGQGRDGSELTIDGIIGSDENSLMEEVINNMKYEILQNVLKTLTYEEQQIIFEIAELFNLSTTSILNKEKSALVKMRHPRNTIKIKNLNE